MARGPIVLSIAATTVWLGAVALLWHPPAVARASGVDSTAGAENIPAYGKDGSLLVPKDYRAWIFLSSGIDMVYGPRGVAMAGHSMFDNVFVNPESYRSFVKDGTWPDKTMLILEIRGAQTNASINHGGHSQGGEIMGMEVHVKDAAKFPGKWAFFDVGASGAGNLIPPPADCYSCHADHAAVDTTFVQFYPTLLPLAKAKQTLSPAYVKDSAAPSK